MSADESILAGMLEDVGGVGEGELRDPREGEHDAKVVDVVLVENSEGAKNPYSLLISYTGMEDAEGKDFDLDDRVTLPTSEAEPFILRMFQSALHSFGLVDRSDRRPYYADTDEQRAVFVKAFQALVGRTIPIRISIDKNGFTRVRIKRS